MKPNGSDRIEAMRMHRAKPAHVWVYLDETFPANLGHDPDLVIAPSQSLAGLDLRCLVGVDCTVCVREERSATRLDRLLGRMAAEQIRRADVFREWLPADDPDRVMIEIIDGGRV